MRSYIHKKRCLGVKSARRSSISSKGLIDYTIPIKALNGDYWRACSKCGYQYLWDGGVIKGIPHAYCAGCGRPIKWPE